MLNYRPLKIYFSKHNNTKRITETIVKERQLKQYPNLYINLFNIKYLIYFLYQ